MLNGERNYREEICIFKKFKRNKNIRYVKPANQHWVSVVVYAPIPSERRPLPTFNALKVVYVSIHAKNLIGPIPYGFSVIFINDATPPFFRLFKINCTIPLT